MPISDFFSTISSAQRAAILVGGLVLFWMGEGLSPLMKRKYRYAPHAGLNLFFTVTTIAVNFVFAYFIVKTSDVLSAGRTGLLYLVQLPLWAQTIVALLIMDLVAAYVAHWVQHKVKWLWQFHLVHHSDMHVDTTTANRHHPGESVLRAAFTLLAVAITGAPIWMVMLYQSISVIMAQFNHANIKLPGWLDAAIAVLFVSPDMHKIHHHYLQPLTDTNYGNIFSIWDRLFGTYAVVRNVREDVKYGIDLLMDENESQHTLSLLRMPFRKYKPVRGSKFENGHPEGTDINKNVT